MLAHARHVITTILVASGLVLLAGCTGSDRKTAPQQAKQVSILFVHGGGWAGGSSAELEPLAIKYRGLGYNAISIEYRDANNNILHQIDNVQAQVSKYRAKGPVVLYGVSAGGTLAAALAAGGKVDGAVVVGAPTDLPAWSSNPYRGFLARKVLQALGMTPAEVRDASPTTRLTGRPAPQLLQYGDSDRLVPLQQRTSYARAAQELQPDIKVETLRGVAHSAALVYTPSYAEHALDWIRQRWPAPDRRGS